MQSIARQLKRGNAVIYFNRVTRSPEIVVKRGAWRESWYNAHRNQMEEERNRYILGITAPLSQEDIRTSKKKNIYKKRQA